MAFQKGQSGNPKGRPPAAAGLKAALEKRFGKDGKALVDKLVKLTKSEDERVVFNAVELLCSYQFGKPTQSVNLSGQVNVPLFATPNGDYPAATND